MNSNYKKIYSGGATDVQLVVAKLRAIGIVPIVKDETESGRLAGFGSAFLGEQELFVHNDEVAKAEKVIAEISAT
ncbi:DUF2007 domain-containing protein [Cellulophaga sp. F20128]|uniref:putative signal transducing protein n=1 Tax=Cellulophaga sp. F20128 TaxID=2926413 RepID=UPI001FF6BC3D|nr:DUF2007 domain-containing protein [Cellulophaga sp. F20128]MCK0157552.1 DUF2007 domain-containing protein [Cellulophaga sp. F20128]